MIPMSIMKTIKTKTFFLLVNFIIIVWFLQLVLSMIIDYLYVCTRWWLNRYWNNFCLWIYLSLSTLFRIIYFWLFSNIIFYKFFGYYFSNFFGYYFSTFREVFKKKKVSLQNPFLSTSGREFFFLDPPEISK